MLSAALREGLLLFESGRVRFDFQWGDSVRGQSRMLLWQMRLYAGFGLLARKLGRNARNYGGRGPGQNAKTSSTLFARRTISRWTRSASETFCEPGNKTFLVGKRAVFEAVERIANP